MVFINLPPTLTEEEELLRQKYARLRKKKKQLQALRAAKPEREQIKEKPVKRPSESAVEAKEQAKKLIMSGAIKLSDKKEKQGFKRSRNLEKKLQDPEKVPVAPVGFQPFAAAHQEDEKEEREERRPRGPRMRGLYDNFVRGEPGQRHEREDRRDDRERDRREREPLPKTGNTVYVHGHGITEELLRKAFSNFGTLVNISMEKERNCGFVTFDKTDSADIAIREVDGAMIDTVQLRVSMARRQPSFEQATQDASNSSWASIVVDKTDSADIAIREVDGAMIDTVQLRVSMARRQPSFEQATQDASNSSWASIVVDKTDSADIAIREVDGAMIDTVQLRVSMARRQPSFEQATQDASNSSWASIVVDKTDSADIAIREVDGAMIDTVQLRVSMARRQPSFEQATQDASNSSWASIGGRSYDRYRTVTSVHGETAAILRTSNAGRFEFFMGIYSCGFVTFDKTDSADIAIRELWICYVR